jgi:Zn-dependent protease with chaperone function
MKKSVLLSVLLLLLLPRAGGADKFSVELEKILGQQVAFALTSGSGVDTDPLLADWVQKVGERVASVSPRRDILPNFTILGTDAANALAAPGGHIFVTRGLLDAIESDDELAVVLAHETGHHVKRHAYQQVQAQFLFLLGASFIQGKNSQQIRNGLVILNALRTLHKSREHEAQADELGIEFAAKTGYDPGGLIQFFDGFDNRKRSRLEEYFATHPSPEKRIHAAEKNPLVTRPTVEQREAMAEAFRERGLVHSARVVKQGKNPLELPPLPPTDTPERLKNEREEVLRLSEKIAKSLSPTVGSQKIGNVLQTLLLINSQGDLRWLYIASRAYTVQTQVEDLMARTSRVARTSPGTYDALMRYADLPPSHPAAQESVLGREEVLQALGRTEGATTPLLRASRAVTTVLIDLNNRFLRFGNEETWLRYGALEGLLRYAESEMARADKMSGIGWRYLAYARIRRYQERLSELIPENDIARRSLWYDLTQKRFGRAFDGTGRTGDVTVRAALAVELSEDPREVEMGRGGTTWADWVGEKDGIPENVATAIRLLTLDVEREIYFARRDGESYENS